MSDHTRRALLGAAATGVSAGLTGCLGGIGPGFGGSCTSRYYLELRQLEDAGLREAALADAPPEREARWEELLETAAVEGEATLATIYGSPVRDGQLVAAGDAYHETGVTVTETASVEAHVLELEYEKGVDAPAGATVVDYEALPAVDRAAFDAMTRDSKDDRFVAAQSVSIGGFEYVYPDDAESDSRFVADSPVWVRYEGEVMEVRVTGTQRTERETFRVTLERVADTPEAFADYLRAEHVADLSGLSEAEREVVRQATESEYDECEPLSGGFQGVVDEFRALPERFRPDGNLLVEFEGETYEADLVNAVV
ncbi:hypothetical protein N0B31_07550 [Salinirubellus salinus]|uniref:Uncharacterized protein n=1 Tax=Salinirubellus salinus TaxID=1364945 RepID=A0A9E7R5V6_9EURY|nr:hypothetical protein [Salinirubellus salinus]UWM56137.1 hypothetical protein N0B31_07550 [Salinirubellus salinus]